MEKSRKLELTLCGMLPYGLKVIHYPYLKPKNIDKVIGLNIEGNQILTNQFDLGTSITIIKPLLHSLSKLTEPILEGGLIPIVELAKISGYSKDFLKITNSDHSTLNPKGLFYTANHNWSNGDLKGFQAFCYSLDLKSFFYIREGKEMVKNQIELFEKLKEWHFNIYDLPSEMFIEKSSLAEN